MRIRVANAIKRTGEPFAFEQSERFEPQEFGERTITFPEPVLVSGTYVYDGKAFTVSAKAEATTGRTPGLAAKTSTTASSGENSKVASMAGR